MEPSPLITKPGPHHSMSKYLRSLKNLKKRDDKAIPLPLKQHDLFEFYKSQGVVINKLMPARFFLKNGLPYEGLLVTDDLSPNETLLKVPRSLFLTSRHAYLSELQKIFQENSEKFWYYDEIEEYMVLTVFLLHEYGKGQNSKFFKLISNLPKDQDVLAMWPSNHLDLFEDEDLKKRVLWRKDDLSKDYNKIKEVLMKYPDLFDISLFTFENYCWIYCLFINRCFGKNSFGYVHMIPVAELLNHECSETFCTKIPKENKAEGGKNENISKETEVIPKEETIKYKNEAETLNEDTTDQSSEEVQSVYPEDYYDLDLLESFEGLNETLNYNKDFIDFLKKTFEFDDITSLLFAYKILNYSLEQAKKQGFLVDFLDLKNKSLLFLNNLEILYKSFFHLKSYKEYAELFKYFDYENYIPEPPKDLFSQEFKEEEFEAMVFQTGKREFYEKNAQVYFNYGWRSNYSLIHNYGMCIEYNKFSSVFLKLDCRDYQCFEEKTLKELVEKGVKLVRFKRFKIKYTKLNNEMMSFFKLLVFDFNENSIEAIFKPIDWHLEIMAVDGILDLIGNCYESKYNLKENEEMLYDKKLGYHEYFAAIYRAERLRIIEYQMKLFNIYKEIAKRRKKGESAAESVRRVEEFENEEEFLRNRHVMFDYLKMMI